MRLPPAARALGQHLGRALTHPLARWAAAGLLLALAGVFLLGPTPGSVARELPPAADWALPAPPSFDAAALAARRAAAPLWASQPAPAPATGDTPPPAPPPRLLGVIRVGTAANPGAAQALFLLPDGHRERASAGATIADGTTVGSLGDTRATMLMADGRGLDLRLLDGPAAPAGP